VQGILEPSIRIRVSTVVCTLAGAGTTRPYCISNGGYADDRWHWSTVCARSKKPYVLICQANAESWCPPTNMPCELSMSTREPSALSLFLIKTVGY